MCFVYVYASEYKHMHITQFRAIEIVLQIFIVEGN